VTGDPAEILVPADGPDDTDRLFARIRALLAKAEATEFAAEAEAFEAKAQQLMTRHGIDQAVIAASGRHASESIDARPLVVRPPHTVLRTALVAVVAESNNCEAIRLGSEPNGGERMEIIGYRSDATWVADLLAPRLLAHLDAQLLQRRPSGLSSGDSAAWARSFVLGYIDEVRGRLEVAAERARTDHARTGDTHTTTSVALALRSRAEAVEAAFRRRHPRTTRSTSRTTRYSTGAADAGRAAGSTAPLARHEVAERRALGRGR
jgi:hypothetical protein